MATEQPIQYSIVVPTYNERENIPILISLIAESFAECKLGTYEVLVVDDGSPDGTRDVVVALQQVYPQLRLLERPRKMGLGSAYISALNEVRGSFVILMDADLSHHPKFIKGMISKQKQGNYDIVTGTRYSMGGGVCGWNWKRILISRTANYIAEILLAPRASDLTGSFRLYRRNVLADIMTRMRSRGYIFQMEVITLASKLGYTIGEVPIVFVDRIYGESKLGPMEIVEELRGLLFLFWTI